MSLAMGRAPAGSLFWQVLVRFVVLFLVGAVIVSEGREAHGHEFDEEEDKDGHERYAFGEVIGGYGASEAGVG